MENKSKMILWFSITLLFLLFIGIIDVIIKGVLGLATYPSRIILYPLLGVFFVGLMFCVIYNVKSSNSKLRYLFNSIIFIVLFEFIIWILLLIQRFARNLGNSQIQNLGPSFVTFHPDFLILPYIRAYYTIIIVILFIVGIFFVKKK